MAAQMDISPSKPVRMIDAPDVQLYNDPLVPVANGNDDSSGISYSIQKMSLHQLQQPQHMIQHPDDNRTAVPQSTKTEQISCWNPNPLNRASTLYRKEGEATSTSTVLKGGIMTTGFVSNNDSTMDGAIHQLPNVEQNFSGQPIHIESSTASINQMSSMPQPIVGEMRNQMTLLGPERPTQAYLSISKPGEPVQKVPVAICWTPCVTIAEAKSSWAGNLTTSKETKPETPGELPKSYETVYCQLFTDPEHRKTLHRHLTWVLHSQKCQKTDSEHCSVVHCPTVKKTLSHMLSCKLGMACPERNCYYSRKIIFDWGTCPEQGCPLCTLWSKLFQQIQNTIGHAEVQKCESLE